MTKQTWNDGGGDFTAEEYALAFDGSDYDENWTKTRVKRHRNLKGSSKDFKEAVVTAMATFREGHIR